MATSLGRLSVAPRGSIEPLTTRGTAHGRGFGVLGLVLRTRLAWIGLAALLVMLFMAATADVLTPYDPDYQDYTRILMPPSADNPLGTDEIGRDVYSRLVYGTRVSLEVGLVAVAIGVVTGVIMPL